MKVSYLADTFYWHDPDFPREKAMRVTATTVARWCKFYYAELLAFRKECKGVKLRIGLLPDAPGDRMAFVVKLLSWIYRCSEVDTFRLLMHDEMIPEEGNNSKFAYYDEADSWFLNLEEREFEELQAAWRNAGLPDDLFYPEDEFFCVPYPGSGILARLWRLLGVQKCYSPKEAERDGVAKMP